MVVVVQPTVLMVNSMASSGSVFIDFEEKIVEVVYMELELTMVELV